MTAALGLAPARARRRIGLAPMIDVVFLLLVFFMLAARFTLDRAIALVTPSAPGGAEDRYEGAPRVVTVAPEGLLLNGAPVALAALAPALAPLMPAPDAAVIVQSRDGATVQQVVVVLDHLAAAGVATLVLAE